MKGGMVGRLVMVGLMIGLFVGQSTASFGSCYSNCFSLCLLHLDSPVTCSVKCLAKCIKTPSPLHPDSLHFCKLGCALKLCSNISTKQNPGVATVESCVKSCPGTCSENYLSPIN
ncbi:hypothetical protein PVL29_013338 [Vitis rotundifolia]|uniref:Thionin-like protein 2 n=1 Tax=Vitis rotundifolia TaxID=103349 RepID=A0AA39DR29_VITRO|nr:hypothetical protein PVL29_013338 [Vitis rotundifolia]